LTTYECPLCRIKIDLEFDYGLRYFWCGDCRNKVIQYWKPYDFGSE